MAENQKDERILALEKEVAFGLWTQVVGQIIELKGLSELIEVENNQNSLGEREILTGVWIRTIGQIIEAISVSTQLRETNKARLIEEQKFAIAGDFLVSIGAAIEVIGGVHVLQEEEGKKQFLVP